MQAELAAAQAALYEMTGEKYTTIDDAVDAELPEDIASMMAEMDAMEASNEAPKAKRKRA